MRQYAKWLEQLPGLPIFVGTPLAFDFSFVVYYLERFAGYNPFGFAAIDLRSLVMGLQRVPFSKSSMDYWPKRWFEERPHTHIALDDAIEQGVAFCNMLAEYPHLKIQTTG